MVGKLWFIFLSFLGVFVGQQHHGITWIYPSTQDESHHKDDITFLVGDPI